MYKNKTCIQQWKIYKIINTHDLVISNYDWFVHELLFLSRLIGRGTVKECYIYMAR